jgi:hypothetical protein
MFEYTIISITIALSIILILKAILLISNYRLENKLNKVKREILVRKFKIAMSDYMLDQIKTNRDNLSSSYKRSCMCRWLDRIGEVKLGNWENIDLDMRFKNIVELNKIYRDKLYGQF